MDAHWIKSPPGRRVIKHWADPRPSWLWSGDGQTLLWRNVAARYFNARGKGKGSKAADAVVPIRGQVARLIRLGSLNRASLSRMQFLAGDRPVSATCACTPVALADGHTALLVVTVDPVAGETDDLLGRHDPLAERILPPGTEFLLMNGGSVAGGSPEALARYAAAVTAQPIPAGDEGQIQAAEGPVAFSRFVAGPEGATLLLFDAATVTAPPPPSVDTPTEAPPPAEPLLPLGLEPVPPQTTPSPGEEPWIEPMHEAPGRGLTSLFDRLADDSALFAPLRPDEDFVPPEAEAPADVPVGQEAAKDDSPSPETTETKPATAEATPIEMLPPEPAEPQPAAASEAPPAIAPEPPPAPVEATNPEAETPPSAAEVEVAEPEPAADLAAGIETPQTSPQLYRLVGRGFTPIAAASEAALPDAAPPAEDVSLVAVDAAGLLPDIAPEAPAPLELAAPETAAVGVNEPAEAETERSAEPEAAPLAAEPSEVPSAEPPPGEPAGFAAAAESSPIILTPESATGTTAPLIESTPLAASAEPMPPGPVADPESVERVSRYNFDELSRILNDRVGGGAETGTRATPPARRALPSVPSATPEGALVTLGGETLVLNRLPLGILVFRDQQVLFANRAITEMTGYESVESLRKAGLAAIFPATDDKAQEAGPVNHLVQRDGAMVPVTARLQSVSWQGKPALMLSASATEVRTGHEAAVRAFAEMLAANRSDGFLETSRNGVIAQISAPARQLLRQSEEAVVGRPIVQLVAPPDAAGLQSFLERPARFAETARPAITVRGADPGLEILLFAQGQAGVITGYFGFIRRVEGGLMPALGAPQNEADPALLARLSRGVRRPLNTVLGFSDLISSAAFGPVENARYLEYARDIKTAGLEIAALVDELDDFARLRDGRYLARPTDIDLASLLESSLTRVRGQANAVRVLLRSAVSESLPRVRADRPSLAQAVLNLLASAIDETPPGGSVVLSAQVDAAGGIAINVRDSAPHTSDIGERFVVFRDGVGRDGEALSSVRSSVGLALTRALLAVNGATLSIEPTAGTGTLFSLSIPPDNVVLVKELPAGAS